MRFLIIASMILGVASTMVAGFGIRMIMLWISTIMFMSRKYGYDFKPKTLLVLECVGFSLSLVTSLVFKSFDWVNCLSYAFFRLLFLAMVIYEHSSYMIITVEEDDSDVK